MDDGEQVEKGVSRVRVVSRERLQRMLAMQEDNGVVAGAKEVLGRGRSTSARGEVVEEADPAGDSSISMVVCVS